DLSRAREAAGVRAVLEPDDLDVLTREPSYEGRSIAAVAADTFGQAQAALEAIDVEDEGLEPLLDPHQAGRDEPFPSGPRTHTRGDVERGFAEADAVVEATYRTQTVLHNSMETHQAVCDWEGDRLVVYISTQYVWGIRDEVSRKLGTPADKVRVVC